MDSYGSGPGAGTSAMDSSGTGGSGSDSGESGSYTGSYTGTGSGSESRTCSNATGIFSNNHELHSKHAYYAGCIDTAKIAADWRRFVRWGESDGGFSIHD